MVSRQRFCIPCSCPVSRRVEIQAYTYAIEKCCMFACLGNLLNRKLSVRGGFLLLFVCLNSTGFLFFNGNKTLLENALRSKRRKKMQLGHTTYILTCLSCIITLEIHPPDSRATALLPASDKSAARGK